ncbi:MAG: hypothetical protein KC502_23310, partial [Myxococcales bacterium]|nr:hypothetical protein [Myxococcales bacterium]
MKLPPIPDLAQSVRAGNRAALGRAITLVESSNPAHTQLAQELLVTLAAADEVTGNAASNAAGNAAGNAASSAADDGTRSPEQPTSIRVGITGVPGVGKSTF